LEASARPYQAKSKEHHLPHYLVMIDVRQFAVPTTLLTGRS
jgi:hypothetical protein